MLLAILITTVLVFVLANSVLAIHLRWKPLILCAVCSMLISLVLPHVVVGVAGLAGSLAVLVAFALVFAYFVAKFDTYDEQHLIAEEAVVNHDSLLPSEAREPETQPGEVLAQAEQPDEIVDLPEIVDAAMAISTFDVMDDQDLRESAKDTDKKIDLDLLNISAAAETAAGLSYAEDFSVEGQDSTVEILDGAAMAGEQTVTETIEELEALDDLMDYAFTQKEQGNIHQALAAFRKALALYPDSESAPFIVIELGNILKNKGAYDEAIQIFSEGRNLSALQYDDMLQQEFVSTIAYLRIVKNILLAQRLGFIPYNEIPGGVFAEINAEFCEWRNLA